MTFLPVARKSRIACASSSSVGCVPPSNLSKSRASAWMRVSSAAAWIASVRSHSSVSWRPSPRAASRARVTGSPESCSTSSPSGSMRRAALGGMCAVPDSSTPNSVPKITSSTSRCSTLRRPSRPRHSPPKNDRTFTGSTLRRDRQPYRPPRRATSDLFLDARGFAREIAQIVELRAAHTAAALHHDVADGGTVGLEGALDALAVGDLAHRERGVEPAVAARDHDAFVGLHTLAVALDDLDLHDHGVARLELGHLARHAPLVQILDYLVHVTYLDPLPRPLGRPATDPIRAAPRPRASAPQSGRAGGAASARPRTSGASGGCRHGRRTIAPAARLSPRTLPAACSAASRAAPARTS